MQACGRLVARMGEQDVDRHIAAGIEIDGGDMAVAMGDLDDPAIDDRYVAARQIGLDIGEPLALLLGRKPRRTGAAIIALTLREVFSEEVLERRGIEPPGVLKQLQPLVRELPVPP